MLIPFLPVSIIAACFPLIITPTRKTHRHCDERSEEATRGISNRSLHLRVRDGGD